MPTGNTTPLIAGTLNRSGRRAVRPVHRNLGAHAPADARRKSNADPHRIQDRTVDLVVDRLLRELTW